MEIDSSNFVKKLVISAYLGQKVSQKVGFVLLF